MLDRGIESPVRCPARLAKLNAVFFSIVQCMAPELRGRRITVNAVAPGPVGTDLFYRGKTEAQVGIRHTSWLIFIRRARKDQPVWVNRFGYYQGRINWSGHLDSIPEGIQSSRRKFADAGPDSIQGSD
jgi:NAD(P)-dependent dehydrogenase (short-subunit alcohol dehydrogenase family)